MYCPYCGLPLRAEAKFCPRCGRQQPAPGATPPPPAPPRPRKPPPHRHALSLRLLLIAIPFLLCLCPLAIYLAGAPPEVASPLATAQAIATQTAIGEGSSTATSSPELYGYTNMEGGYAFNYPAHWSGVETRADVVFSLPDGATVHAHAEPAVAGQTLDQYAAEANEFPPRDILSSQTTALGGEPAVCQTIANPGETLALSYTCLALHNNKRYVILITDLNIIGEQEAAASLSDFELLMISFVFLDE